MTDASSSSAVFSEQDEHFMRRAMALAAQAEDDGEVPVGAVLVKEGEIIAEGINASIATQDPTAHAEIQAIRQAGKVLDNYRLLETTLYVTLEPCAMCSGALLHGRVSRVVYGASDPKMGCAGSVENIFTSEVAFHKVQVQGGLLEEECRTQLQQFFRRRRAEKKALKN